MEKVFENDFVTVSYDKNHELVKAVLYDKTLYMSAEQFKEIMLVYRKCFEDFTVQRFLINSSEFMFTIVPEVQEWTNREVIGYAIGRGLKKLAFVVSSDIFAQVSIEQTMENSESSFQTLYFDDEKEAKAWLLA